MVGHGLLSLRVGVRLEVGELVDGDVYLGDGRRVVDVPHRPQEGGLQPGLGDQLFEGHLGMAKLEDCAELFSKVSYIDLQESGDVGSKECHVCFKSLTFGVALERTVAALMLVPSARTTPAAC